MASSPVNDENHWVYRGRKYDGSSDDSFAIEQPTGRQSILRQTENLPSKTVPKAKVCFQTPIRDPLTKRFLSPVRMENLDECVSAMNSLRLNSITSLQEGTQAVATEDNDAMDPFEGSNDMGLSPTPPSFEPLPIPQTEPQRENVLKEAGETETPLDETLPFNPSVENSLADVSTESSIVTLTKNPAPEDLDSSTALPAEEPSAAVSLNATQDDTPAAAPFAEDTPLPAKSAYVLDFDNLDAINPFQTGGSKIPNSPTLGKGFPGNQPEASPVQMANPEIVVDVPKAVNEASTGPEAKPVTTLAPISNVNTEAPDSEATVEPADPPVKSGPVKLEFNFDDGAEVKHRPPPKRFGKKRPSAKAPEKKPAQEKHPEPPQEQSAVTGVDLDVDTPIPKVAYSFDLDKLDDPNFNPFDTNVKMDNRCSVKSSPAGKVPPVVEEMAVPEPPSQQATSPCAGGDVANMEASTDHGEIPPQEEPKPIPAHNLELQLETERRTPEPVELGGKLDWNSQTVLVENSEEFVPGTTFISSDFDGQMDYLEQFGSTDFKESALRKQSLYLKFDPLLRDSPKKAGAPAGHINPPRPSAMAFRLESAQMMQQPTMDSFKLIDATAPQLVEALVQDHTMLESLVPPTNTEEAIIEVLKYSQKDMDAAIARVKAEAKEKEEQMTCEYQKLHKDGQEMRGIIAEFELTIAKILEDHEKERAAAKAKLDAALVENKQMSKDLDALDHSLLQHLERLEKYKRVLEGYKKNEETLKGCAEEYLARIRKEEQRYQTLKAHAEGKLTKANEEIGEVKSRLKAEVLGLQTQLRREKLKSQSLENNFNQKVKEVEELTNMCDELIAKVQKD